jgi:amidophosphoribosyltransferase
LIAPRKKIGEISKLIGADSLGYLSIDGMVEALRIPRDQLCLGCITGEYPVPIDGEKYRFQERLDKRWGYR